MGLKAERKKAGLTLHALAAVSGVNYVKIHCIETGKIDIRHIWLETALKLARALGCEPKDLIDITEIEIPSCPPNYCGTCLPGDCKYNR